MSAMPSGEADCVARIRAYVSGSFMLALDAVPIEESLVESGVIDSYGIVELAAWLEREFEIAIQDDEIVRDNFGSIVQMARFVTRKQRPAAPR